MNKKGSLLDNIFLVWTGVIGIIMAVILVTVFSSIFGVMKDNTTGTAHQIMADGEEGFPIWIDRGVFYIYIGLMLGGVLLAVFVNYNPISIFLSFLVYIVAVFIGILGQRIVSFVVSNFPATMETLPHLAFMTEYFVQINIIGLVLMIIAMMVTPIGRM
jgi:hypothetical protein